MNRILFESDEIRDGVVTFDDVRAEHVLGVLHGEVGQTLKTGEVNGKIGTAEIVKIEDRAVTVRVCHDRESLKPWVDLVLAPPRPRVMKRLLPQLATMGVGRIFLVGAKKVEKDFWGATLLKEENYRPLLIDGLMQGGTSVLPTLETRRNFRKFVAEELDGLCPSSRRLVAHPYGAAATRTLEHSNNRTLAQSNNQTIEQSNNQTLEHSNNQTIEQSNNQTILTLAVGPEGGWTDEEVELLEAHGFARYSLGPRILRTDTAIIALLARLMDIG